jgi:hypothetical protein
MDNKTEKKWYQKPTAVVLLLIFFFPVGLYLMWKHEVWSKTARWTISAVFTLAVIINGGKEDSSTSSSISTNAIERTQICLVGYDWVYPSGNSPTGAWKFSSDGTFNSSTTMFGGMSTWGNWSVTSPGKVKVSYTRTSEGTIPGDQILTMSSCNELNVGSTSYSKD